MNIKHPQRLENTRPIDPMDELLYEMEFKEEEKVKHEAFKESKENPFDPKPFPPLYIIQQLASNYHTICGIKLKAKEEKSSTKKVLIFRKFGL